MNGAIAIIGAGVTGAAAASELRLQGVPFQVFDKGRTAGGRAATRTRDRAHFDHGAQYFTARDPRFRQQVEQWRQAGVVAEWRPRLIAIDSGGVQTLGLNEPRWVGVPGMRELATDLLTDAELCCSHRVIGLEHSNAGWTLHFKTKATQGPFSTVLCTQPPAQSVQLLGQERVAEAARTVEFAPCWALMLEFDQPLPVEFDAAFVNLGPLSWIARDSSKPGRPNCERWVLHGGPDFSREHLDAPAEAVTRLMLDAFCYLANLASISPRSSLLHRWGYALAQPALEVGIIADEQRRIALGGDWCHGSRIEGAYLSGLKLAEWAAKLA